MKTNEGNSGEPYSQSKLWEELCNDKNRNPLDLRYNLVMKKLSANNSTSEMDEDIGEFLFPRHEIEMS